MRKLLGLLLCILLLQSQVYALSGGPVYGNQNNSVGTYAGALLLESVFPANPQPNQGEIATIGIYALEIPEVDLGSGVFVLFNQGEITRGTIESFADARSGVVFGILEEASTGLAGTLDAQVVVSRAFGAGNVANLTGSAQISVESPVTGVIELLTFDVIGYRQSTSTSTTSTFAF